MKKKQDYLIIPINIYRRGVLVFFGDRKRFLEIVKEKAPEDFDFAVKETEDMTGTLAVTFGGNADVYIYAEQIPLLMTIVHESLHAAQFILEQVGVDLSDIEAVAYLQEYIFTILWDWVNSSCDVP